MHVAVRGHRRRERRQPHEVRALGDDALAGLDAVDDLHDVAGCAPRASPPAARTSRPRAARTRSAVPHRPRWPRPARRAAARSCPSADEGTTAWPTGRPSVRLSNANVIGSVRDCGSSTLPTLDQPAGRHAVLVPGHFDLRCRDARRARAASASGTCPTTCICDASTTRNRMRAGATRSRRSRRRAAAMTPSIGRADDEQARPASAAPPARAALYCARLASAAVSRALRLLLGCARLVEPLLRRSARGRQPLGALAIARREGERRLRVGPRALQLRQIARHRRAAAAAAPVPARARRAPRARRRATRVSRPSIGATTSAAPPGRASSRAGTANRLAHGLLPHDARSRSPGSTAVP